jgi:hypothetical protein
MRTKAAGRREDQRARVLDEAFDADRRRVGERVAVSAGSSWRCWPPRATCERVNPTEALARVVAGSGSAFEPVIVDGLRRAVEDGGLDLVSPELALPATA